MKLNKILFTAGMALGMVLATSCSDDMTEKLRSEAKIENFGTYVTSPSGKVYKTKVSDDGHIIYIKINPYIDATVELNGAVPTFFLSMGATVTPPMTEPQDFSNLDAPVEYTVTSADGKHTDKFYITYTVSDKIGYGEGFTNAELAQCKTYVEMGFPGTYASWVTWEDTVDPKKGDLLGFPAFCGGKFVFFSRRYAWGDNGANDSRNAMAANPSLAFKVYDKETMTESGKLNLGSIDVAQVVAITNDWKGNMVAAVGRKAGGKTDFYYWTSPESAPVHLGTANVSTEIGNHDTDGGSYINVAGDITTDAVIAAAAPRADDGPHYKFKVKKGQVTPTPEIIKTGHSSNDQAWFQMISYFGTDDTAPYMVGDTQTNAPEDNGQIKIYLNNSNGTNRATMDYHNPLVNGWTHDNGEQWWSRSGKWLSRGGGRRPTVHAMVMNGKEYTYFTTGSDWNNRGIMLDTEFNDGYISYPSFGYGLTTLAKDPKGEQGTFWVGNSFGAMATWYFDDEEQEGYIAVWTDRFGVHMFKLTCYE